VTPNEPAWLTRARRKLWTNKRIRARRHAHAMRTARWARQSVQSANRAFVRRKRRHLAGMSLVVFVLSTLAWQWSPGPDRLSGFVAGAIAASGIAGLGQLMVSATGTANRRAGIDAEVWTATELRRARRDGWEILHGLPLQYGDVDHIAIGRGWVLVLETKWSSQPWDLVGNDRSVADAAAQVRHGAERVARLLPTIGITSARVRGVVVLWGRLVDGQEERQGLDTSGDRVAIVHGTHLRTFLSAIRPRADDLPERTWDALATVIEQRDAYNARRNPPPPSRSDQVLQVLAGLGAGLTSVLLLVQLVVEVLGQRSNIGAGLLTVGFGCAVGALVRYWVRYPATRRFVAGALAALVPFIAILAVSVVRTML
jgi:hypothetical protein